MSTHDDTDGLFPDLAPPTQESSQDALFEHDQDSDKSFQTLGVKGNYSPDDAPFDTFYVPLLSRAISYDRAVGYWSAAELQFAAQGTAHFLANGGKMRLIVGAQLRRRTSMRSFVANPWMTLWRSGCSQIPISKGKQIVEQEHLSVLAWMVATDRLEIRVGVPCEGTASRLLTRSRASTSTPSTASSPTVRQQGRLHGLQQRLGDAWVKNHETFDAYPSWN